MQTTDPTLDVNSFISHILANPSQLIQVVLQQLMGASAGQDSSADTPDIGAVIASALGTGPGLLGDADEQPERLVPDAVEPQLHSALISQMIDQNCLLAAALGACECWGLNENCGVCAGFGASGWTRPDRALFTEFVYPAMRAIGPPRSGVRGRRPQPYDTQRKDSWR